MSSVRSPDLRLELRTDWRVLTVLVAWLGLAIACVWSAALPVAVAVVVTVAALLLAVPALRSQVFGGRRAGTVLGWSAEGSWHCKGVGGTFQHLEVSPVSRVFPGGALLVFRPHSSVRWVLLLGRRGDGGALRRLRMRLNLERRRSVGRAPRPVDGTAVGSSGGS